MYLSVFTYLADWYAPREKLFGVVSDELSSYGTFASSALAGQSLSRAFDDIINLHCSDLIS
jgi:hypothetical protein